MNYSLTIRRLFAAFFLLLFSFCVTPKRFLHDILANHRDTQTSPGLPVEQIANSGYHCHIDDLVVVAPFLSDIPANCAAILSSVVIQFSEPLRTDVLTYTAHRDTRGPPAAFCC